MSENNVERKISDLKVGDQVYCMDRYKGISIYKINKETKTTFIVEVKNSLGNAYTIKIRKTDGYEIGSQGSGSYGSFYTRHWYPITDEVLLERDITIAKRTVKNLVDRFSVNKNNFDRVNKELIPLLKIIIEENKVKE